MDMRVGNPAKVGTADCGVGVDGKLVFPKQAEASKDRVAPMKIRKDFITVDYNHDPSSSCYNLIFREIKFRRVGNDRKRQDP
jgi:hypothetical protein